MLRTPEDTIATLALAGVGIVLVVYFFRWLFAGPVLPNPWDESIATQLESSDAAPLCHRCLIAHSSYDHFCPECGAAVGEYNNMLPFEQLFSEGEVFRNGTTQRLRPTFLVVGGYLLMSSAAYMVFAPFYWFFLLRNLSRQPVVALGEIETTPSLPPRE